MGEARTGPGPERAGAFERAVEAAKASLMAKEAEPARTADGDARETMGVAGVQATPRRRFDEQTRDLRISIKAAAHEASRLGATLERQWHGGDANVAEMAANLQLAFRHLEDASMRLGKVQQARDGGVSVYDRPSTVGA